MGQLATIADDTQLTPVTDMGLQAQLQYAQTISQAGIVPASYKGRPADVLIAMGLGQSMGLSPAESLYRINVINGKPTMSAELVAAQVRKAGHKLRIRKDAANLSVTVEIVRADDPEFPFRVTRDRAWAEQMGLAGKDNYKRQPLTMLTWRAITACAREACPEALYGVAYTPDEMSIDAVSTPAEPVQDGEVARAGKVAELTNLLRDKGFAGWADALPRIGRILGRDVTSVNDLNIDDLDKTITALDKKENTNEAE